jgi:hypothetical protein
LGENLRRRGIDGASFLIRLNVADVHDGCYASNSPKRLFLRISPGTPEQGVCRFEKGACVANCDEEEYSSGAHRGLHGLEHVASERGNSR